MVQTVDEKVGKENRAVQLMRRKTVVTFKQEDGQEVQGDQSGKQSSGCLGDENGIVAGAARPKEDQGASPQAELADLCPS